MSASSGPSATWARENMRPDIDAAETRCLPRALAARAERCSGTCCGRLPPGVVDRHGRARLRCPAPCGGMTRAASGWNTPHGRRSQWAASMLRSVSRSPLAIVRMLHSIRIGIAPLLPVCETRHVGTMCRTSRRSLRPLFDGELATVMTCCERHATMIQKATCMSV